MRAPVRFVRMCGGIGWDRKYARQFRPITEPLEWGRGYLERAVVWDGLNVAMLVPADDSREDDPPPLDVLATAYTVNLAHAVQTLLAVNVPAVRTLLSYTAVTLRRVPGSAFLTLLEWLEDDTDG
jgi:hypothetical protein